jgi:hypothetical protein
MEGTTMIFNPGSASTSRFTTRTSAVQLFGLTAFALSVAASSFACGGSTTTKDTNGGNDTEGGINQADSGAAREAADSGAGPLLDSGPGTITRDAAPDTGPGPNTMYPAFPVDVAQVGNNGGSVLAAPVIVSITWSSDPDAPTLDAFGDAIGGSSYWHAINSEYGVGPATSGAANHVSITTPPPAGMADSDLDALVEANAGTSWPAFTPNTIYTIYMPEGMALYLGGEPDAGGMDACSQGIGGYHIESMTHNYVYAIVPHCSTGAGAAADLSYVELAASHELNEAATDPHPYTNNAYSGFDQNHLAFEFFNSFQDELGDACEGFATAADAVDFTPYTVQRQWSNKSAAAGSQWCLPALAEPFYNTTFLPGTALSTITVNLSDIGFGNTPATSKGFKLAVGQSLTFPIGFFSDKDTGGPWTIESYVPQIYIPDNSGNPITTGTATMTFDKTSGQNGEIANVTITPTAFNAVGVVTLAIKSTLPGSQQSHYLPLLISQN